MEAAARSITAREAVPADVPAFAELLREAWRQAGPDAPGFAGATDEIIASLATPDAILERMGGPDRRLFIAWRGHEAVGFASTRRIDSRRTELAGIIVLESAAGHGIGTALVAAATNSAAAEGFGQMIVRTETTNLRAHAFYGRRGFEVVATATEDIEGTVVNVTELCRDLTAPSPAP